MELPPKPEPERRQRIGQYGEIVDELTPESEIRWANYLREKRLAEIAIRSLNDTTTNAEGSTG